MAPAGKYIENTPGELQEWIDYLDEILDAIARGLCDSTLKDIARACFDRRDVNAGREPGSTFVGRDQAPALTGALPTAPPVTPPVVVRSSKGTQSWETYDGQGAFVGRVPAIPPDQIDSTYGQKCVVNGKTYLKAHLKDKTIRVPMTANPAYIRNLRVKVTGIGGVKAKVEFIDPPKDGSDYRKRYDTKQPVFLPLSSLKDILE